MRYPQQGTYCGSVTFIKPFVILMLCSDSSDFLTQNKQTKTQQNKFNTFFFSFLQHYLHTRGTTVYNLTTGRSVYATSKLYLFILLKYIAVMIEFLK